MIKGENGVTAMTVKSKKVYKWLLSLAGEGQLIVTPVRDKKVL